MLELMLLALVGLIVGAFGTVVGVGGGFLLVPVLLFAYPSLDPSTVTAMSLVAVCANALSGAAAYGRQRRIDFASGGLMAAASLPGAYLGAVAVRHVERSTFVVVFAVVLALLGGMLLLPRGTQRIRAPLVGRGIFARSITDRQGDTFVYRYRVWQGLVIGVGVGFISSLLGIGGGILQVPMMSTVLRFPVHIATATSQFVLALTALVYPHYFRPRTMQLGRYFGIYEDGRLAAMIGERLGTPAAREMSAICTHPDFLGRGYARRLTAFLANDTLAQGRLPFLHVSHANTRAKQLYKRSGWRIRRDIPFWRLARA